MFIPTHFSWPETSRPHFFGNLNPPTAETCLSWRWPHLCHCPQKSPETCWEAVCLFAISSSLHRTNNERITFHSMPETQRCFFVFFLISLRRACEAVLIYHAGGTRIFYPEKFCCNYCAFAVKCLLQFSCRQVQKVKTKKIKMWKKQEVG